MLDFEVSGCSEVCKKGEWYIYAGGEIKQIYDGRQIMYNVTRSTLGNSFKSGAFRTSTEYYAIGFTVLAFAGDRTGSIYTSGTSDRRYFPTLSFTLY